MNPKISLITVIAGAALVLAVPAWGKGQAPVVSPEAMAEDGFDRAVAAQQALWMAEDGFDRAVAAKLALQSSPYVVVHDHGDATQAKLSVQQFPVEIVRDHGDATQAKLVAQSSPRLEIVRDHGDATQAKLSVQQFPVEIVRDHGDATQAKVALQTSPETFSPETPSLSGREIEWSQLGIGVLIGTVFALGLILAVRFTRSRPLAH